MYMLPEAAGEMVSKLVLNCKRFVKLDRLSFLVFLCYTGDTVTAVMTRDRCFRRRSEKGE